MLKQVQHDGRDDVIVPFERHPELVSGSIFSLAGSRGVKAECHGEVLPVRVVLLDQIDFPRPVPSFQLLFASDRAGHVSEHLEAYEAEDIIARGKSGIGAGAVLVKTREQVRGHSDVDRSIVPAGEDVDARLLAHGRTTNTSRAEEWMLKQVQHDGVGMLRS